MALLFGYQFAMMISLPAMIITQKRLQLDDWYCGNSDMTRKVWFETINEKCDGIMLAVNHCCVMHDECYTHQQGREKCDREFCECNRRASISNNKCLDFLEASCSLVQILGFVAYSNSANYTEPTDLVKYTLHNDYLSDRYINIYRRCPKVNATLSSCALQYNLCENPSIECAESLSQCLHDAATVDGSSSCHGAIEAMCDATFEEVNSWRNSFNVLRFWDSNVMVGSSNTSGIN
ncbi:hypothetical protein KIN20_001458 [Parelaphostrongylus tenuis]|uniref:Uncharacterized protein n=1 Tax=Parelaphostrongylus tenuis TaxID=148309 RepID=A0AAD5MM66_PARTN|nr:hypothetical protein KIN20_001458 [Parelaphostrongylus tenuis]